MIALLSFTSCDKDENHPFDLTEEGLLGKWDLYQYQGNTGEEDYRTAYEPTGKTFTFFTNGKLNAVGWGGECNAGEYQVADHILTLVFDCEEDVPERTYYMKREKENLVISPLAPTICIEGCSYIFKRIN